MGKLDAFLKLAPATREETSPRDVFVEWLDKDAPPVSREEAEAYLMVDLGLSQGEARSLIWCSL